LNQAKKEKKKRSFGSSELIKLGADSTVLVIQVLVAKSVVGSQIWWGIWSIPLDFCVVWVAMAQMGEGK
jgi:hypothetical protein